MISPPPHACAACKHQRRRCSLYCPLAPYFPAENQKDFKNVRKLFGLSYAAKLIESTPENLRDDAVKSIVYEANIRAADPVGGCCTVISELQNRINYCLSELDVVRKQLAFRRAAGFLQARADLPYADLEFQSTVNYGQMEEIMNVEMVKSLYGNLSVSNRFTGSSNEENCRIGVLQPFSNYTGSVIQGTGSVEIMQPFLDDNPVKQQESNEFRGNDGVKDEDGGKPN